MLKFDISFKVRGLPFHFCAEVEKGVPYVFDVGEGALADKLFAVFCGLDTDYKGVIEAGEICFKHNTNNNVLAIGERTMFIKGSVRKNIYKALRARAGRKLSKQRADSLMVQSEKDSLADLAEKQISELTDDELTRVAFARAAFREIELVVVKYYGGYAQNPIVDRWLSGKTCCVIEII